jgi:hypothetical protein
MRKTSLLCKDVSVWLTGCRIIVNRHSTGAHRVPTAYRGDWTIDGIRFDVTQ